MQDRGATFKRAGKELVCLCPLHEDRNPSFRVNPEKEMWMCDPCGVGGSIIDLVMKIDGIDAGEAMRRLGGEESKAIQPSNGASKIVATYDYQNEKGDLAFQVVRLEPKSFRQRHKQNGEWSWSMDGVKRVLYNLPAVQKAQFVWVVEGEKDANTLIQMGLCATCNAGGAGKWIPEYSDSLRGKELVLCGDNDEAGRRHIDKILEATAGAVKSTRIVVVPTGKDVSEYAGTFTSRAEAAEAIVNLADAADVLIKGVRVPVYSMVELEREYREFAKRIESVSLNLGTWLPSMGRVVRPLVPGEVAGIVADTGIGKTMLLQNLALHTRLLTLLFEIELPNTLTFERFAAMATKSPAGHVHAQYSVKSDVPWRATQKLDHIYVCPESKLTPADIERIITRAGLKIGQQPALVLIDYVQLIRGAGTSRYDRMSAVAEELKVIAKSTSTIIVVASQIHRKGEDEGGEVFIHDAKDSGSIENSAGLMLGAWRDAKDKARLWLKVMKNTKGTSGHRVACRILESLLIVEEAMDAAPQRV